MAKKTGGFFLGTLIGAATAAITALLFAPKSGKELRDDLAVEADRLKNQVADYTDIVIEKGIELSEVAKSATEDIRVNLSDSAAQWKETILKTTDTLKEEWKAGTDKAQETIAEVGEELGKVTEKAIETAKDSVETVKEQVADKIETVKETTKEAIEEDKA